MSSPATNTIPLHLWNHR